MLITPAIRFTAWAVCNLILLKLQYFVAFNKWYVLLVFPPATKKGMVKFSRKGHFQRAAACEEGAFKRAWTYKEGIEFDVTLYKLYPSLVLSMPFIEQIIYKLFYVLPANWQSQSSGTPIMNLLVRSLPQFLTRLST